MKYCEQCFSAFPDDFAVCPKDQTPLRAAAELMPGMVLLGKYRIVEKIGSGGMAVVYRAQHVTFDEPRAIKVVNSQLLEDHEFIARFKTEAIITRKLQHPNAVRVDDLEMTEDGRPFIVMEYVQGTSLRELLHEQGSLPAGRAVSIAQQAAAALAAAHKIGITHRDIKPENILLVAQPDGSDLVKVLDFGIATMRRGADYVNAGFTPTQTGTVIGTPQYLSPEQARGAREVDGRSDIYSLGIVLYEMATGTLPFACDSPVEFLNAHLNTPPIPPEHAAPEKHIPQELSEIILTALEKEPEGRFASADEMAEALAKLAQWSPSDTGFTLGPEIVQTATYTIHRAVDNRTKKQVAMRLVNLDNRLVSRASVYEEVSSTAEAARALDSPNIPRVLGTGERDGKFYVATEFVEGVLLRDALAKGVPLPLSEITDLARQACLAFAHAHTRHVVHGNLHPGNIITEWDGTVKFLDYGISVFPDDDHAGADRLRYTAPEHAGGDPADVRADIFSLGAVLYEMATGKQAFPGSDATEVMNKLLNEEPPPVHEINPTLDPGLSLVIAKALAKSPDERYQNAAVLMRDIENYRSLGGSSVVSAAPAPKTQAAGAAVAAAKPELMTALESASAPAIRVKPPTPTAPSPVEAPPAPRARPVAVKRSGPNWNLIIGGGAVVVLVIVIAVLAWLVRRPVEAPAPATETPTAPATETSSAPSHASSAPRTHTTVPTPVQPSSTAEAGPAVGDVMIVTTPPGATIQLDGRELPGTSPQTIMGAAVGQHTVTVRHAGFRTETRAFAVTGGQAFHLNVTMQAEGALLSVRSDPMGAAIFIDEQNSGYTTPAEFVWQPGAHTVSLRKPGYLNATTTATLREGQTFRYSTPLLAAGDTSSMKAKGLFGGRPEGMGSVKVETQPKGAQVSINGKNVGKSTPLEVNLQPGNYEVLVQMPGYKPVTRVVTVTQGQTVKLSETMPRQ